MSVPFERCVAVTDDPSVLFRLVHVAMWNVQHWPRRAWRRCLTRPSSPSWPPRERRGLWKGDWGLAALTAVWLRDTYTQRSFSNQPQTKPELRTKDGQKNAQTAAETKERTERTKREPLWSSLMAITLSCCPALGLGLQFTTKGAQSPSQSLLLKDFCLRSTFFYNHF